VKRIRAHSAEPSACGQAVDLYEGWVRHRRFGLVQRSFRHRVFMTLSGAGPRRTLEMPRSFGVGFNPVRFHFGMDGDEVASLAAEVTNTPWGERHSYEFEGRAGRAEKVLRVSPFLDMDHEYVCHASAPGRHLTVHVENLRAGERVFDATLSLERRPPGELRRLRLRYPAQTLRVLALIYGHAALVAGRGVANRTFGRHPSR
jgi:DUF1365 family protein